MRLAGKAAIVTGAGSGIGKAIAHVFAREGAKILVAEIEDISGRETVQEIASAGGTAHFQHTDVANPADTEAMAQAAVSRFGRLDILVNNAAAFVFGPIDEATPDKWRKVLGVNVVGPANCAKSVVGAMRQAGGGAIVNIASVSGFIAQPDFVPYNVSKGGLLQLTRCLAMDLAKDNIRVNGICPGEIRTRATDYHVATLGIDPEIAYRKLAEVSVLKRMGRPEEVAYGALFLASDEASFITGTHLVIDGGATLD